MYCRNCGAENMDTARFCSNCATPVCSDITPNKRKNGCLLVLAWLFFFPIMLVITIVKSTKLNKLIKLVLISFVVLVSVQGYTDILRQNEEEADVLYIDAQTLISSKEYIEAQEKLNEILTSYGNTDKVEDAKSLLKEIQPKIDKLKLEEKAKEKAKEKTEEKENIEKVEQVLVKTNADNKNGTILFPVTVLDMYYSKKDYNWSLRIRNNTNKSIDSVYLGWFCCDDEGFRLRDKLSGKGIQLMQFSKQLKAGETSETLSTSLESTGNGGFYNESFVSIEWDFIIVVFSDNTETDEDNITESTKDNWDSYYGIVE